MKLYQGAFLIGLALVLSACGFLAPDGTVPGQPQQPIQEPPVPELEEPPDAFINGAPGRAVSWCWTGGCADGFVDDPSILPAVGAPFALTLAQGWRVEGVSAVLGEFPDLRTVEVAHDGIAIGELPAGAVMLNVFARHENGGDASYYWAVIPPGSGPSSAPSQP